MVIAKLKDALLEGFIKPDLVVHVMKEKVFEVPFQIAFKDGLVPLIDPKV